MSSNKTPEGGGLNK
jgi:ATP-binding cassette, subfamily B (MDR/TAP), member 1